MSHKLFCAALPKFLLLDCLHLSHLLLLTTLGKRLWSASQAHGHPSWALKALVELNMIRYGECSIGFRFSNEALSFPWVGGSYKFVEPILSLWPDWYSRSINCISLWTSVYRFSMDGEGVVQWLQCPKSVVWSPHSNACIRLD